MLRFVIKGEYGDNIPGTDVPKDIYHSGPPGITYASLPSTFSTPTVLPVQQMQNVATPTIVTQATPTVYPSQITDVSQLFPPPSQFPSMYPQLYPQTQQAPIINIIPSTTTPSSTVSTLTNYAKNIPNWAIPALLAIVFGLLIMRSGKEQQEKLLGRY